MCSISLPIQSSSSVKARHCDLHLDLRLPLMSRRGIEATDAMGNLVEGLFGLHLRPVDPCPRLHWQLVDGSRCCHCVVHDLLRQHVTVDHLGGSRAREPRTVSASSMTRGGLPGRADIGEADSRD
ncbi:hypothetical protein NL676_031942 [Syzygium grande]|nr:hypothetical protein NL676_031942 [Syzygium grande]